MGWRTVVITSPARLQCRNRQLEIELEDGPASIPIEDLAALVIDGSQITLSVPLVRDLACAGVVVFVCDAKHMPCGILHSYSQHSRHTEVLHSQIAASAPLKKQLWQRIVKQKIVNQSQCLKILGNPEGAAEVACLRDKVLSGDSSNIEATAARAYWKRLFDGPFRRHASDNLNAALNFGYAIVRSAVSRALVVRGFHPALGVHHSNKLNAFNLADDVVEPFRPFVDLRVYNWFQSHPDEFSKECRGNLAALIGDQISCGNESLTLSRGAERISSSLMEALENNEAQRLILPEFII